MRLIDVNHAAVKLMVAHGKDELKACSGSIILRCSHDIVAECLATAAEGARVYETETVLTNLHGERRNVLLCVSFSHGTAFFRNVFISIMDITERKNAEEALLQVRSELARVTRSATLGELTSMVAHEVERPLDAIFENSRQAAQRLRIATGCDAITTELVQRIISDARHAAEVVDGVRKFLRQSSGEAGSFVLGDALASTVRLLGSTLLTHEITLHTEIAPDLPEVVGESNWLEHVLVYLLLKAVQALAKRPKRDRALDLTVGCTGTEIVIRISSRSGGAVLPPEDSPITRDIGMSVCRTSVEAQGGRILVTPDAGVSVIFPPEKPLL
jgi:C4-dicarboxylate-specific signal transduction histidine kinase